MSFRALLLGVTALASACALSTAGDEGSSTSTTHHEGATGSGGSLFPVTTSSGDGVTSSSSSAAVTASASSASAGSGGMGGTGGATASSGTGGGPPTDWWDPSWGYRVKIKLTNHAQGEDLVDFPVLVTLTAGKVKLTNLADAGADVRFVDPDGTLLDHEIEQWQPGAKVLWVRVPQVDKGTDEDFIWLYYGNPSATDAQNPGGVWQNDYTAVLHLGDDLGTSSPQLHDSSGHANDGAWTAATGAGTTAGEAGDGVHVKGAAAITIADSGDFDAANNEDRTFELWFKTAAQQGITTFVSKYGDCRGWSASIGDSGSTKGTVTAEVITADDCNDPSPKTATVTSTGTDYGDSAFHQLVVVSKRDGEETLAVYLDGVQVGLQTPADNKSGNDGPLVIQGVDGIFDELRASDVARSTAWIAAGRLSASDAFTAFQPNETY